MSFVAIHKRSVILLSTSWLGYLLSNLQLKHNIIYFLPLKGWSSLIFEDQIEGFGGPIVSIASSVGRSEENLLNFI